MLGIAPTVPTTDCNLGKSGGMAYDRRACSMFTTLHICVRRVRRVVTGKEPSLNHALERRERLRYRHVLVFLEQSFLRRLVEVVAGVEDTAERVPQLGQRLGDHVRAQSRDRVLRVQSTELGGVSRDRHALGVRDTVDVDDRHLAERQRELEPGKRVARDALVLERDAAVGEEQPDELSAPRHVKVL
ncbi:hypothetical protein PybrP1_002552 [[Pythium] brassicae (nom. inval.)]|nr:hypothetical protein PybrP1_002552 [[Pythium] brassicae (nom. inval.)]